MIDPICKGCGFRYSNMIGAINDPDFCFRCAPIRLLNVKNPSKVEQPIEPARCTGDHFFEDVCNACGAAQSSGSCEICPHLPIGYGPGGYGPIDTKAEHYSRRPCRSCGSADLRSVRMRAPL